MIRIQPSATFLVYFLFFKYIITRLPNSKHVPKINEHCLFKKDVSIISLDSHSSWTFSTTILQMCSAILFTKMHFKKFRQVISRSQKAICHFKGHPYRSPGETVFYWCAVYVVSVLCLYLSNLVNDIMLHWLVSYFTKQAPAFTFHAILMIPMFLLHPKFPPSMTIRWDLTPHLCPSPISQATDVIQQMQMKEMYWHVSTAWDVL